MFPTSVTEIFIILATLTAILISFVRHRYKYWSRLGVPTLQPKFPLGNAYTLFPKSMSLGAASAKFYSDLKKSGEKFGGIFLVTEPKLILVDPEYIKDVMVKDFPCFVDRGFYHNERDDPISAHLFALDGRKWKTLRTKLTPTFTSGKMKIMFNTLTECSENMRKFLSDKFTSAQDVEIKEILGCFTTDVIGSCAFGIDCNSFRHPDAEFRKMGRKIFDYGFVKSMVGFMLLYFPKLSLTLGLCINRPVIQKFFTGVVKDTVRAREEKKIKRDDFLQILIDLKNHATSDDSLKPFLNSKGEIFTENEIAAQVFLFFIAGFETSSTAMNFGLYELAKNQGVQEKLRREVEEALKKYDGKYTYESLKDMKYLQQVVDETLRMYPPIPTLSRRSMKPYKLRDTGIELETETSVLIPVLGLHMDPEYFPNPEIFDPDRFEEDKKKRIKPFTYLPFGDGPRNCIGLRFGIMQSKIGIATIIKNFKVTLSPSTKKVEFDQRGFLLNSVNKVYVRLEKIC